MFKGNNLPHELLLTTTVNKVKKSIWKEYVNWYKMV